MARHSGPRKQINWRGEWYWVKNQWFFFWKPRIKLQLAKLFAKITNLLRKTIR